MQLTVRVRARARVKCISVQLYFHGQGCGQSHTPKQAPYWAHSTQALMLQKPRRIEEQI